MTTIVDVLGRNGANVMPEVFISYPRSDATIAKLIQRGLEAAGYEVFTDTMITSSPPFADQLDQRLRRATAVVACWSIEAFRSSWCMNECSLANTLGILVPVQTRPFENSDVHLEFVRLNYINLLGWAGEEADIGWRRILNELSRLSSVPLPSQGQMSAL